MTTVLDPQITIKKLTFRIMNLRSPLQRLLLKRLKRPVRYGQYGLALVAQCCVIAPRKRASSRNLGPNLSRSPVVVKS